MTRPSLDSILLASTDPQRLHAWYAATLDPSENAQMDVYLVLRFGSFYVMFDRRDDVGDRAPEPGRIILNFDVPDARAVVTRMEEAGTRWLAPLEDRGGSLFATAIDPDGNYVQVIQPSPEQRAAMEAGAADQPVG